jgi:hypothetical protein
MAPKHQAPLNTWQWQGLALTIKNIGTLHYTTGLAYSKKGNSVKECCIEARLCGRSERQRRGKGMNNPEDILEVYNSALKYFDKKGYIVVAPSGTVNYIEVSNSPKNNVEIRLIAEVDGVNQSESGKYRAYGTLTFCLGKTEETDQKFADQIMQDMKYFMEHFEDAIE